MKEKYTIEDIEQQLLPEIAAIKSTLLTKGFIVEGTFTSINHMILYHNEVQLIEFLESETGLNLSCIINDSIAAIILFDCDRYTYETAKTLS